MNAPHALIITGGTREARRAFAVREAAARQCARRDGTSCGVCAGCRKTLEGTHPDMDIVAAAGREIVVDTVRAVKAALSLLPGEGFCRVVIFDEADTLNPHAQNALLAVLEEPPSHAAFLLCTAVPEALLLTVRSRCAVVRLPHAEETAEEPDESVASLVAAIAQKDEWACCQIVLSWEKCKREELEKRLFQLSAALRTRLETADPLTGKRFYCILDGVCALRDSLRRNAGVGHVCGALACQLVN